MHKSKLAGFITPAVPTTCRERPTCAAVRSACRCQAPGVVPAGARNGKVQQVDLSVAFRSQECCSFNILQIWCNYCVNHWIYIE
jgi:hypothetical protein